MGSHLHHGKGYWWTLSRIVIKIAPLHPSLADVIAVISILLIYYFLQHPPLPPLEKMFIAYFWHWWLKNWLRTVQHPMKWYYWIIKQKIIIIIIKWVRWPAVLSCDWWLDFVAAVTFAVCEGGVGVSPKKVEKLAPKKEKIEKWDPPPPPSQGLGNITSSTILSCTVICSRQNPRLYCTVLCYAQYSSVLYSTGLNCKATFVFPFRDSRKMPLSRPPPRNWHFFTSEAAGIK